MWAPTRDPEVLPAVLRLAIEVLPTPTLNRLLAEPLETWTRGVMCNRYGDRCFVGIAEDSRFDSSYYDREARRPLVWHGLRQDAITDFDDWFLADRKETQVALIHAAVRTELGRRG